MRVRSSSPEGAWCWQSKATIRYIRENVTEAECATLLTYYALTKLASDNESSRFAVNRALIASEAMLSLSSVKRALSNLDNLGVIEVERPNGLRTKNTYVLLSVGPERTDDGSERADVGSQLKQGSLEPLTEEKRKTKKKREGTRSKNSDETVISHEAIYQAYPKHVGKKAALKAIAQACKTNKPEHLLERTVSYSKDVSAWPDTERQFVPYPATWFNRGSYKDDPAEWQRSSDGDKANVSSNAYAGRAL